MAQYIGSVNLGSYTFTGQITAVNLENIKIGLGGYVPEAFGAILPGEGGVDTNFRELPGGWRGKAIATRGQNISSNYIDVAISWDTSSNALLIEHLTYFESYFSGGRGTAVFRIEMGLQSNPNIFAFDFTFDIVNPSYREYNYNIYLYPGFSTTPNPKSYTNTIRTRDTTGPTTYPYEIRIYNGANPSNIWSREGYEPNGWDKSEYISGPDLVFPANTIPQSGLSLTARWTEIAINMYVGVNNSWRKVDIIYVSTGGYWREANKLYARKDNAWKECK